MASVLKLIQGMSLRVKRPQVLSLQRCLSSKPDVKEKQDEAPPYDSNDTLRFTLMHTPTDFDKRILVFVGNYKKVEDVPKQVSAASFDRARNKARIKISNYMMLATGIACIGMAVSGRKAAERGESVHQMNLDWHKEINSRKD